MKTLKRIGWILTVALALVVELVAGVPVGIVVDVVSDDDDESPAMEEREPCHH